MKRFTLFQIITDLKRTLLLSLTLSLTVFAWLRIIFYDIPFSFSNEGLGLLNTIGTYWLVLFVGKLAVNLMLSFGEALAKPGARLDVATAEER